MPNLIIDLDIDRVDLVDEGANSAAFIELYKRKEQNKRMTVEEILSKLKPEHAQVIQEALDAAAEETRKAKEECDKACGERDAAKEECDKACGERDAAKEECDNACRERDKLKAEKAKSGAAFDETETLKGMPESAREYVAKLKAQKEAAEEEVRKAREAEAVAAATAKAANLKAIPIEQSKLVDILKSATPEIEELLTTVNAAIESTVLTEVGKSATGNTSGADAWSKIEAKAEEISKRDSVTKQKAVAIAISENPELYKEYLKGGAN